MFAHFFLINTSKSVFAVVFFKNTVSLSQKKSKEYSAWGIYPPGTLHSSKSYTSLYTDTKEGKKKKPVFKHKCIYIFMWPFRHKYIGLIQDNVFTCLVDRLYFCLNGHNLHSCNTFYILSSLLRPAYSCSSQTQNSHWRTES